MEWNVWPPAKKKEKKEGEGKPSEAKEPEFPTYESLCLPPRELHLARKWKQGVLDFLHSKHIEPEGQLKELLQILQFSCSAVQRMVVCQSNCPQIEVDEARVWLKELNNHLPRGQTTFGPDYHRGVHH